MESTTPSVEPTLAQYKHAIFDAYVAFKRHLTKDPHYQPGLVLSNASEKAAVICKRLQANPKEYVAAQFLAFGADTWPSMLHCTKSEENYKKAVSDYADLLPKLYRVQMGYLFEQLRTKRSVKDILMDERINFTPWFRVIISKEPIPEVIQKYQAEAKKALTSALKAFLLKENLDVTRLS